MKRIGKLLYTVFHPGVPIVMGGVAVTALLMLYVFVLGHAGGPLAYAAYLISAYSLTILIIWLVGALKPPVVRLLHKNKWIHRYLTDTPFRTVVSLYRQAGFNLAYVVMKFAMGVCYRSVWFVMLSVYYLLLTLMRALLLRKSGAETMGRDQRSEYRKYRTCGLVLLLMNIVLTVFVLLVIRQNQSYRYAGMLIYVMAAYTFFLFIKAILDLIKYRKHASPLISASKALNFAAALISLLALETAMLSEFGGDDAVFRRLMVAATGGAISVIFIVSTVYMVIHSTKELRRLAMEKLRSAVKPLDAVAVRAVIERETGKRIDEIYAEFHDEPIGSASIARKKNSTFAWRRRIRGSLGSFALRTNPLFPVPRLLMN